MNLTRLLSGTILNVFGCASMWAQTAPLTPAPLVPNSVVPNPAVPKPFQFDASQYKLLLPNRPVTLTPSGPLTAALQIVPGNRPCAAARIMKPNPAIDRGMLPRSSGPAPTPIEAHSRDVTEKNVPAPSCADIATQQELNASPEKP